METKVCPACKENKPVSEFSKKTKQRNGLRPCCRDCMKMKYREKIRIDPDYFNRKQNERRKKDPDYRIGAYQRHKERKYGISQEKFDKILKLQKDKCAICGIHQRDLKRKLAIDHNHETEVVRGLLCTNCNFLIGYANENLDVLQNSINYLKTKNYEDLRKCI